MFGLCFCQRLWVCLPYNVHTNREHGCYLFTVARKNVREVPVCKHLFVHSISLCFSSFFSLETERNLKTSFLLFLAWPRILWWTWWKRREFVVRVRLVLINYLLFYFLPSSFFVTRAYHTIEGHTQKVTAVSSRAKKKKETSHRHFSTNTTLNILSLHSSSQRR